MKFKKMKSMIKNIYEVVRKNRVKVLLATLVISLLLFGGIAQALVVRKGKVEKLDKKLADIYSESKALTGQMKVLEKRLTATDQTYNQINQGVEELEGVEEEILNKNDAYNQDTEAWNQWLNGWNSKPHYSSSWAVVNRGNALIKEANTLVGEHNALVDQINAKSTEFENLLTTMFSLKDEIDSLREGMDETEAILNEDYKSHKRTVQSVRQKKNFLSIYALDFNKDFRAFEAKIKDIKVKPVLEQIEELNIKIDELETKMDELNPAINQGRTIYQDITEKTASVDGKNARLTEIRNTLEHL